jgi:hypothetical protein
LFIDCGLLETSRREKLRGSPKRALTSGALASVSSRRTAVNTCAMTRLCETVTRAASVVMSRLALVLLMLASAACQDLGQQLPAGTSTTAPPTVTAPTPSGGAREVPPEGVTAQSDWREGGDPGPEYQAWCDMPDGSSPRMGLDPDGTAVEIGRYTFLCFYGFNPHRSVRVTLEGPDGEQRRLADRISESGTRAAFLSLTPKDPTGLYTATAMQGGRRARLTFRVRPSASPTAFTRELGHRRGASVPVVLSGFRPSERVLLVIYRREDANGRWRFVYFTSLELAVDSRGQAVYQLDTQPLPSGTYGLGSRPASGLPDWPISSQFWVK